MMAWTKPKVWRHVLEEDYEALLKVARETKELVDSDRWRGLSALETYIERIRLALAALPEGLLDE